MVQIRTRLALTATAVAATVGATMLAATPANAASVSELPQLKQGSRGMYVLALQAELNRNGYHLQGTGYFGSRTKSSVISWQKKNHIKASGIVGPKTWASLSGCGVPDPNHASISVKPGQQMTTEKQWWFMTQDLAWSAHYFPALGTLPPTNEWPARYDGQYLKVVKGLQQRAGIKPTGIIGPETSKVVSLIASTQSDCVN